MVLPVLLLVCAGGAGAAGVWMRFSRSRGLPGLEVRTSPAGCGVRLDGSYLGIAPVEVSGLSPGEHFVEARREGYANSTVRVTLAAGEPARSVRISLKPLETGGLDVRSTPLGAIVVLDGENRGNTPTKIEGLHPGQHRLVLRRARYEPWGATLKVAPGKTATVDAVMDDSFLKFLNGAVTAEPKNMYHRAEKFHYLMTREDWKAAAGSFFEAVEIMVSGGVNDPPKGLWYWFSRDGRNLAGDQGETFARELGRRLAELSAAEDGGPVAAKIVKLMGARGNARPRRRRGLEILRKLCFAVAKEAAGSRDVAEAALEVATEVRDGAEVGRILAAAGKARPKESEHIGWLAVKVVNLVKGGDIGGSFRGEALEAATVALEGVLKTEKKRTLRGRLCRLLGKIELLQEKPQEALAQMDKAIAELKAAGSKEEAGRLFSWRLERARLLAALNRVEDARRVLKELVGQAPDPELRKRAAAELAGLKPAEK